MPVSDGRPSRASPLQKNFSGFVKTGQESLRVDPIEPSPTWVIGMFYTRLHDSDVDRLNMAAEKLITDRPIKMSGTIVLCVAGHVAQIVRIGLPAEQQPIS